MGDGGLRSGWIDARVGTFVISEDWEAATAAYQLESRHSDPVQDSFVFLEMLLPRVGLDGWVCFEGLKLDTLLWHVVFDSVKVELRLLIIGKEREYSTW